MITIIGPRGKFTVEETTGKRVGRGSQAYWGVKSVDLDEYRKWLTANGFDLTGEIDIAEVTVVMNNGQRLPASERARARFLVLQAGF